MSDIPGFGIYSDCAACPLCGEDLKRNEDDWELRATERVEYTTCYGEKAHRWRILDSRREPSAWFYKLSGPVE